MSQKASDPRRLTGRLGEQLAAAHLERLGFLIVARNVRTPQGEIDLIAHDGHTLVFAEVKTARATRLRAADPARPEPLQSLRAPQRLRLRRLAGAWLSNAGGKFPRAAEIRFDALGVLIDARGELLRLDHLEGAW